MAKCIVCGKKGLFLKVNVDGRCKECEERFQQEEADRTQIEKERLIEEERALLRSQETQGLFPLSLHSYIVTDIETTGLRPIVNGIIEIAAIKVKNNEVVDRYSSLVKTLRVITGEITSLTGITPEMIKNAPKDINTVIHEYADFVGNYPLIGHNISSFDIKFLNEDYIDHLKRPIENKCVDTLTLARKYILGVENYKLQTLSAHLGLQSNGAHRAMADCETTLALYRYISEAAQHCQPDLTQNEEEIVKMTKRLFGDTDASYFRYEKKTQCLSGKCFYEIFSIRTEGRLKNYFEFANKYEPIVLEKTTLRTTPRSQKYPERGNRIFFETEEEFLSLSDVIKEIYDSQRKEIEEEIELERNFDNTGFIRIDSYKPHFEKSVCEYLENPHLIKL